MNCGLEEMAKTASERGYKIFAVTDHNSDAKFAGEMIKYYPQHDIYLVRGKENRCKNILSIALPNGQTEILKDDEKMLSEIRREQISQLGELDAEKVKIERAEYNDMILLGYHDHIDSFRPLVRTMKEAREKGAIVIATSPFNNSAKGLHKRRLENSAVLQNLDAMEILNADSGFGWLCYSDIRACKFSRDNNLPGIFVNDAHTLREIGLAGFGVKKTYAPFEAEPNLTLENYLKNPRRIADNPPEFIEALRGILQNRAFTNQGRYIPLFSIGYADKRQTLSHKHAILRD
jgi:hypothetical protein